MAENEEELKSLLIKVKEESKTASLKLSIQKANIMAFGPIISWQIVGGTVSLSFLGSKSLQMLTATIKLKDVYSLEEKL